MIIAVDIGNTNFKLGIFSDDDIPVFYKSVSVFEIVNNNAVFDNIVSCIRMFLNNRSVEKMVVSSVNQSGNFRANEISEVFTSSECHYISADMNMPFINNYDNPSQLGSDRIADMAAVRSFYSGNAIIINSGTALVISVLFGNSFEGGVIIPGVQLMIDSLTKNTVLIKNTSLLTNCRLLGRSTEEAVSFGIMNSIIFTVNAYIEKIRDEYNSDFKIFITGGNGKIISDNIDFENTYLKYLTLQGIKTLFN